jgi:dihydroorotate dehydrogenase
MLYKILIRPLLFRFNPESVHHWTKNFLKIVFKVPGAAFVIKKLYQFDHPSLETEVFGLKFKNPVGIAAGFDKNAELFNEMSAFGFGHVEIGTVTPLGQKGNPKPRIFRLKKDLALINRLGFNNLGVEKVRNNLERKRHNNLIVGGNLGKNTLTPNSNAISDYLKTFEQLFKYVDYFTINVSCPNISDMCELQDRDFLEELLIDIQSINNKKEDPKPILLKVAPDLNNQQLDDVIEVVKKTGIDGVIATNTTITRNNLKTSWEPLGSGGLSGKPLAQRSTEVIRYLSQKSDNAFPIIGVGGIFSPKDAIEKLDAGAKLVQVYTGFVYEGPGIAKRINKALLNRSLT